MKQKEVNKIIRLHKMWLEKEHGGKRADLRWAKLQGANLYGAYLESLALQWADLESSNLQEADLRWANLSPEQREVAEKGGAILQKK